MPAIPPPTTATSTLTFSLRAGKRCSTGQSGLACISTAQPSKFVEDEKYDSSSELPSSLLAVRSGRKAGYVWVSKSYNTLAPSLYCTSNPRHLADYGDALPYTLEAIISVDWLGFFKISTNLLQAGQMNVSGLGALRWVSEVIWSMILTLKLEASLLSLGFAW